MGLCGRLKPKTAVKLSQLVQEETLFCMVWIYRVKRYFIRKCWDICRISYDVYLWFLVMYVCIVYILWWKHHNILSQRRKIINVMTLNNFIGTTNYIQMHIPLSIYISIWIRGLVCHHFWLKRIINIYIFITRVLQKLSEQVFPIGACENPFLHVIHSTATSTWGSYQDDQVVHAYPSRC